MTRILVVDDHAAVRAGLMGLLRREPGLVPLDAVSTASEAVREARRLEPEIALIDYQLPDGDGLTLCRDLKGLPTPPRVVVYSAFARPALAVAAKFAGADGMLDKGVEVDAMFESIRAVARGETVLPSLAPEMVSRCTTRLDPDDVPIFGMVMSGTSLVDIASVLAIDEQQVDDRIRGMLGDLLAEAPHDGGPRDGAPPHHPRSSDRQGLGKMGEDA